ncbi:MULTISPECIES: PTS mannose/fructose/sorbose/N-acetylgalactosamine transporter subunit IIC [Clostridium]|uniref:PTS sugar transporter subunit IIC n=1 Tax=Clostridium nitritogenes TaxID=83340 RepID=A0ABP3X2M5_9CLOT|nr:PTS sugar transporter subunit IIC [Clostridium baratii]STB00805.1 PTS system sorbose-specific transporter subunit IIC [Clostridium baratii]
MIQWWQITLLTLYACYQLLDELTINSSAGSPVFAGLFTGLVMGDLTTGLLIGGSMQLTVLGVGTFGGASRIDANSGTVLATAFSVGLGMDPELAISAIAVPVASLMIQTDILARFANTFFVHRIDKNIENHEYKKITINYLLGALPWGLSRGIPVCLALAFGGPFVEKVVDFMNTNLVWLSNGLSVAGALLPAVGFAILLRYLPAKKHIAYLILGFIVTALLTTVYGNISAIGGGLSTLSNGEFVGSFTGLPMLAIALIGLSLAMMEYKRSSVDQKVVTESVSSVEDGEIDDDEI